MSKVKMIPCSGIGKVLGLLSREVTFAVTERLRPDKAEAVCLAHIVTGDEEATAKVVGQLCISVDGCPKLCAAKSIEALGGVIAEKYRVVDEMRNHQGEEPGNGTALTDAGWRIVDEYAAQIAEKVDEILEEAK